jgi:hypothetical protein
MIMKKKIIKGLLKGLLGVDFKKIFDDDGDGKISRKELFSLENWIAAGSGIGTSILAAMQLL